MFIFFHEYPSEALPLKNINLFYSLIRFVVSWHFLSYTLYTANVTDCSHLGMSAELSA